MVDKLLREGGTDRAHPAMPDLPRRHGPISAAMNEVWDDWVAPGDARRRSDQCRRAWPSQWKIEIVVTGCAVDRVGAAPIPMTISPRLRSTLGLLALVLAVTAGASLTRLVESDRVGHDVAALARPGDIEMIASDTCAYRSKARAWFHAHDVPFTECSIERDTACANRFRRADGAGHPLFFVRGRPRLASTRSASPTRCSAP